jgi:poly(3-hydroxybutyrate) depolymerase
VKNVEQRVEAVAHLHRSCPHLPSIRRVGLLTVEGENDDISGIGQTLAAQELCRGIPPSMKANYLQNKVGHFGVFNGSRFRNEIVPRIREFHAQI